MRIFTFCLFVFTCVFGSSYGQLAEVKSSVPEPVPEYPLSLYKKATADAQNLYNGRLYYVYNARDEEHQFFVNRKLEKGTVFYDGQHYDAVPMMYDIVRDELVILHANGYENILLQSPKVEYFSFYDHQFRRFESGKGINPEMRTGFYDELYTGKTKALARRTKEKQEKIAERKVIALFPEKVFYYIYKNGKYNSVRSRKSVLTLFPAHKSEMRRVLREKNIRFRKSRETAIVLMVTRYDELTNQ